MLVELLADCTYGPVSDDGKRRLYIHSQHVTCRRVAILVNKATQQANVDLPNDVAFFIAKRINSNVRELEGALKRVIASARFTGRDIDIKFAKEALRDLLAL